MNRPSGFEPLAALKPQAVRCPYPIYSQLRQGAPAAWVPEIESWVVSRYDEICSIGRNPTLFSSRMPTGPVATRQMLDGIRAIAEADPDLAAKVDSLRGGAQAPRVLLNADPPEHIRQRRLVARAFTPARIRETEPSLKRIINELAARIADIGVIDFVDDFAVPFPLLVIAEWLGVPAEDLPRFKRWSDEFVRTIGNSSMTVDEQRDSMLSRYEFSAYFADHVSDRKTAPNGDLISLVVEAGADNDQLTESEVLYVLNQFLVAGNETTTSALTFAIWTLLSRLDLADRLRSEPALIPSFVEEVLRLESPVQGLYRVANEDTTVGDVPIKAGDSLLLLFASGNRDSHRWSSADEVNLDARTSQQLAFGVGEHVCIGATLARAELRLALELLLERFDISVAPGVDLANLEYHSSFLIHHIKHLPVVFTARKSEAAVSH